MSIHPKPIYQHLAGLIIARDNCVRRGNTEWRHRHEDNAHRIVKQFMPSGSGLDTGTKLDLQECLRNPGERLVFYAPFHHMNEAGVYDGWTEHTVIVTPSLWSEFHLRITGKDRNDIKDYLYEVFSHALTREIHQTADGEWHEFKPKPDLVPPLEWALSQVEDDLDLDHQAAKAAAQSLLNQAKSS